MDPQILDSTGKPIQSQKYDNCPDCGRGPQDRVSSGFGAAYLICPCGREFKELTCSLDIS